MTIEVIPANDKKQLSVNSKEATIRRSYTIKDCDAFNDISAFGALIDFLGGTIGSPLPDDNSYVMQDIDIQSLGTKNNLYNAIVTWATPSGSGNQEPEIEGVEIGFSTEDEQKIIRIDQDGQPLINAAQEKFNEAIFGIENICVFDCKTNSNYFDWQNAYEIVNAVNRDSFLGMPERTLKFTDLRASPTKDGYDVTFKLSYKKDTWDVVVANAGFNAWQFYDGEWKVLPIKKGGLPVSEPMGLKQNGQALAEGDPINYLTFRVLNEVSFSEYLL